MAAGNMPTSLNCIPLLSYFSPPFLKAGTSLAETWSNPSPPTPHVPLSKCADRSNRPRKPPIIFPSPPLKQSVFFTLCPPTLVAPLNSLRPRSRLLIGHRWPRPPFVVLSISARDLFTSLKQQPAGGLVTPTFFFFEPPPSFFPCRRMKMPCSMGSRQPGQVKLPGISFPPSLDLTFL